MCQKPLKDWRLLFIQTLTEIGKEKRPTQSLTGFLYLEKKMYGPEDDNDDDYDELTDGTEEEIEGREIVISEDPPVTYPTEASIWVEED